MAADAIAVAEAVTQREHLPDAWLAACVMRHGEHLVTFDRDFRGLLPEAQLTSLTVKP